MTKWKDLQDTNPEPSLLDAVVFATGNKPEDASFRHGFKVMKKIELNPTQQDWVDYLNSKYQWAYSTGEITLPMMERLLWVSGYIKVKEQPE